MTIRGFVMVVVSALCAASGCARVIGGPCEYTDTPGTATIVSVSDAEPDANNCANDPVVVVFDFAPADPGDEAGAATGWHLTIAGGANPPRAWVQAEGLIEGTQHACVRSDIVTGTCSPVVYEFSNADYEAGIAACY